MDGILMIAVQALEERTVEQEKQVRVSLERRSVGPATDVRSIDG
jgi:hypothetical protein